MGGCVQNYLSGSGPTEEPGRRVPPWVLESINEAKRSRSRELSLAITYPGDPRERLKHLPAELFELSELTSLSVQGHRIKTIPESITRLVNLRTLNLSENEFGDLPGFVQDLQQLMEINLNSNEFSEFPDVLTGLQNLTYLYLSKNQLTALPDSFTQLSKLNTLNLAGNRFGTFPESIVRLENLKTLNLMENRLKTIPQSVTNLQNLKYLFLADNPLINPPIEIARQGIEAIREYFRQLKQEGVDYLYEAKLLVLGEGGAGKTTFARKILDANYALRDEDTTRGVDVLKWSFPLAGNQQFMVNIWDFGGQEIYHATHQFFLTKRSLYTLITDTRKEDTDFYYWLNVADLLSGGSPLIIVKNEKQDRHREINERQLKGQFDSLKEVLATNLATNRGLEEVKEEIKHYIRKLPHIGSPLPKTWVRVREQLEKDPRNYISLEKYIEICEANGFAEPRDSLQLSSYLHDIGVFLHFQDDPLLKRTVVLKPKWGTDAVYKVLDNKTVIRNMGRFTQNDLETIWDTPEYKEMRDELLQLMMKFKLCYEIPTQAGVYIAPQLLTENQPEYKWDDKENLLLRYTYEFMPKGLLTQFIVVMHPYIWQQNTVWKSGVVIERDQTRAEVIEYYGKREVQVRVAGPEARDFMTIIRHELRRIHEAYKKLRYDEWIRCNCSACKDSQEPHFYTFAELLDFKANNQLEIQCRKKPYHMVNVMGLLGDLIDINKTSEKETVPSIYIQGNYYQGDHKMTDIHQNIEGSTIHGSVVAAESIQDSFNTIEKSNAKEDLKEQLKQLAKAVDALAKELPKEKAEEVAEDMKVLAEQATKEKPNPKWYNVSIEGLITAAQNLGKVGDEVIELTGKVRKILTGGLL